MLVPLHITARVPAGSDALGCAPPAHHAPARDLAGLHHGPALLHTSFTFPVLILCASAIGFVLGTYLPFCLFGDGKSM